MKEDKQSGAEQIIRRGKQMAMILCPECGKPISDQAKYCLHCGFSLEKVGAVRVEMSGALFDGWAVFFPPGCHRTKREGVDEIKTEKDG